MADQIYAYLDESANLADKNRFFIVGVVSTISKKEIGRILKKARKSILRKKKRQLPELKFSRVVKRVAIYVLKKLARKKIAVYAWIVDKKGRRVKDTPENYGLILGYALKYGFTLAAWSKVWVDEKYNKKRDRQKLKRILRKILGREIVDQKRVIFSKSGKEAGLGLADFVAGAFYTAYNRGDYELIDLIKEKIVMEEKVLWREIKQKATAPRGSVGLA